ncbi:hypothetical protein MKY34_04890 [Sporosarcina sp. FSL K6-1522]|uniref:hypothetical protein n=1 Tax=Sporosarcina sp. FSL K6-1522 TaxID=2921554 RepID=UPI00315AE7DF
MRKKYVMIAIICSGLFLFLTPFPDQASLTSVFRVTEEPAVITRGINGSALTVNLSFGDLEVEQWIRELNTPYPFLFVDTGWANRFPETIKLINEKNIPVGLLGHAGNAYDQNTALFTGQLEQFQALFGTKPLWFRTADEVFPHSLQLMLWEAEVNALGSSFSWHGANPPPVKPGEIISVPHNREQRTDLTALHKLYDTRTFQPLEDVLFNPTIKTKKTPK